MKKLLKWFAAPALLILLIAGCANADGGDSIENLSYDQAVEQVHAYVESGKVKYGTASHEPDPSWIGADTSADDMPPIEKYPLSVEGKADVNVEIFSSTEKSSLKDQRWLDAVAKDFNKSGATVNGQSVSISVRPMASGLAYDYIQSRAYVPDAYSPSNELWAGMIEASGVDTQLVEQKLAGNTAGIMIKQAAYDKFASKYGEVTVASVVQAALAGDLKLAHTDPNKSSTGLNILVHELLAMDPSDPLSAAATEQFQQFQATVPPTMPTTDEMAKAAAKGQADAMIMESQALAAQPELGSGWVYTPAGVRHDSPLYALNDPSSDTVEVLQQFAAFAKSGDNQQLAKTFGFNQHDDYQGAANNLSGAQLTGILGLWKQYKDAGRPVISVFVVDRSGSMNEGSRLARAKQAILAGAQHINPDNYVGLVSYSGSSDITVDLPIAQFNDDQHSLLVGAVKSLEADGATATNSALYAGLDLMLKAKADIPDAKIRILVMSDGDQTHGLGLGETISVVKGLGVPVYGIGFEADLKDLDKLAEPNEGYTVNADSEDVVIKLRDLFRAEL